MGKTVVLGKPFDTQNRAKPGEFYLLRLFLGHLWWLGMVCRGFSMDLAQNIRRANPFTIYRGLNRHLSLDFLDQEL